MPKSTTLPAAMRAFTPLGPNLFLYVPNTSAEEKSLSTSSPSLVILCSWMGAAPKHISKYVAGYQKLYPDARILLLRNELIDILRPPVFHHERLAPALDVVLSKAAQPSRGNGILLHMFSNGGANVATQLAYLHHKRTSQPLPIKGMLLDSCPGTVANPASGVRGFMSAFPASTTSAPARLLALISAWIYMGMLFVVVAITGGENSVTRLRRLLNDNTVIPQTSVRTYVFSASDDLVDAADVKRHAAEAERKGWKGRVRYEEFTGTRHVAHVMQDPEKYWSIVKNTYEEGVKQ